MNPWTAPRTSACQFVSEPGRVAGAGDAEHEGQAHSDAGRDEDADALHRAASYFSAGLSGREGTVPGTVPETVPAECLNLT